MPALLRKTHEAKLCGNSYLAVWGTGTPRREFLHVDDLAELVKAAGLAKRPVGK